MTVDQIQIMKNIISSKRQGQKNLWAMAVMLPVFSFMISCDIDSPYVDYIDIGDQPAVIQFEHTAGRYSIDIATNRYWHFDVDENADWLIASQISGVAGEARLSVSYDMNKTYEPRSATATLTAGDISRVINFAQKAAPIPQSTISNFTISPDKVNIPVKGGDFSVSIDSPIGYEIVSMPDWITISRRDSDADVIIFNVSECTSIYSREGVIKFENADKSRAELHVVQDGENCVFDVLNHDYKVSGEETVITLEVVSNSGCSIVSIPGWISIVSKKDASSNNITLIVDENKSGKKRNGVIILENSVGSRLYVYVDQDPA